MVNYNKIYNELIDRAKTRELIGYYEKHHIIPKCMGGNNDLSNIAKLTAEEHYLAHQLLVKLYPENNSLLFAAHMMTRSNGKHVRNNKEYSWLRKRRAVAASKFATGRKRGKYTKIKLKDAYVVSIELIGMFKFLHLYNCKSMAIFNTVETVQKIVNILYGSAK